MTTYEWTNVRERAVTGFGDQYPPNLLEAAIVEAFERDPVSVLGAIDRTAERYAQGKVNSPWHYLAKQAAQILADAPDVHASDTGSRERAVANAEAWIHVAGLHFDRAEEVEAELFDGLLRDFADDQQLRERMLALWREVQFKGQRTQEEHEERMRRVLESPHSKSVPDWKPPKGFESLVGPIVRGRDAGVGRCDDCRKDDKERVVYGLVKVCRECAGKRDVTHGMAVPTT